MGGYVVEALIDELRRFRQLECLFDTIRMMLELDKEQWNPRLGCARRMVECRSECDEHG